MYTTLISQLNMTNYRTQHTVTAYCTLSSSARGIFTKTDHMLVHYMSLEKFKGVKS